MQISKAGIREFHPLLKKRIADPNPLVVAILLLNKPDTIRKEVYREIDNFIDAQKAEKLALLAAHYGVKLGKTSWELHLLLRLTEDLLEGFKLESMRAHKRKRGRPSKGVGGLELIKAV